MNTRKTPLFQQFASLPMLLMLPVFTLAVKLGQGERIHAMLRDRMHAPANKIRVFKGYQPSEHDLFVCTYSKSGTNWMMQIAFQIAHRGRGEYEHIHDVVPWPDAPMPGIVPLKDEWAWRNAPTGYRVIKTHLEAPYVPYSPVAKYIVVARDPKEAFVSSYYFFDGMVPGMNVPPPDQWLQAFFSDRFFFGSWSEHLASYWPWRNRPNVAWLTYGEMKADLPGTVQRIAQLMQVDLSGKEVAQVVEKSSFQYMKQIDHKFLPQMPFAKWLPRRGKSPVMMRQGEAGKSSELITLAQQREIDQKMQAELQQRLCDFPYSEKFQVAI